MSLVSRTEAFANIAAQILSSVIKYLNRFSQISCFCTLELPPPFLCPDVIRRRSQAEVKLEPTRSAIKVKREESKKGKYLKLLIMFSQFISCRFLDTACI